MQNNIIKLPDEEAMHSHYFCSKCHFWLINEQLVGANYCPNCGQKLDWNETSVKENIFKEFIKISEERYSNLKCVALNKIEYQIDKELTIADCYGYPATLICSTETLNEMSSDLFSHNWTTGDTYKGHPLIIDNNLKLNEFKVLKRGEKYNAK